MNCSRSGVGATVHATKSTDSSKGNWGWHFKGTINGVGESCFVFGFFEIWTGIGIDDSVRSRYDVWCGWKWRYDGILGSYRFANLLQCVVMIYTRRIGREDNQERYPLKTSEVQIVITTNREIREELI